MRVKRIEKEINRTIIESNQVPDSVLDKARREMKNSTPTIPIQVRKLYRRKLNFIAVSLACICMLLIAITTLLVLQGKSNGTGPLDLVDDGEKIEKYDYIELTKEPIQSVAFYNQKYNTKFISLKNLEVIDSFYYSKEDTFVMLEENYQYQDKIVNLKIMNKNVEISYEEDESIAYTEKSNFETYEYWYTQQNDTMFISIVEQKIAYHFSFPYYDNYEEIVQLFYENC